jgi:alanine dehydrogenase
MDASTLINLLAVLAGTGGGMLASWVIMSAKVTRLEVRVDQLEKRDDHHDAKAETILIKLDELKNEVLKLKWELINQRDQKL